METTRKNCCPALGALERQEARQGEMRDVLLRLEGRLERLAEGLARVSGEEGVNRCVDRTNRLESLEERFAALCGRFWTLSMAAVSAAFMVVAKAVWETAGK